MHLTDRERQAISSKEILTVQAKKARIKEWDLEVWTAFTPKVKAHEKNSDAYWCYCPYCQKGEKKTGIHNVTGLVYPHSNGDGLGFACKACGTKHPRVYEFLGKGSAKAEEYAWKRFEIDAVGKGWYCPHPQRWKEISELNRKRKAAHHKERDARRKREHQIAYALRDQEALKAAKPQTPPRPKGSCSVSKDEAARERERFASRPVRRSQGA